MNAYTLYLTRSNTVPGLISKQQFASLQDAELFAKAYAIKWVVKFDGKIISSGTRN